MFTWNISSLPISVYLVLKSAAIRLCSIMNIVWYIAKYGCSFTLLSPIVKHLKSDFSFLCRHCNSFITVYILPSVVIFEWVAYAILFYRLFLEKKTMLSHFHNLHFFRYRSHSRNWTFWSHYIIIEKSFELRSHKLGHIPQRSDDIISNHFVCSRLKALINSYFCTLKTLIHQHIRY